MSEYRTDTTLEQMQEQFDEYGDWRNVWSFASDRPTFNSSPPSGPTPVLGSKVSDAPFTPHDVDTLFGSINGENDGREWVCFGKLKDGRYFALRAGCDYTGWG